MCSDNQVTFVTRGKVTKFHENALAAKQNKKNLISVWTKLYTVMGFSTAEKWPEGFKGLK